MRTQSTCAAALHAILMMMIPTATATAQVSFENDMATDQSRNLVAAALMNITFSEPNNTHCGGDHNNDNDDHSHDRARAGALQIAIRTIPQDKVCFNLGNTFSDPLANYSQLGNECEQNTICGVNYTVTAADFRLQANYSSIFYTQIRNPFDGEEEGLEQGRDGGRGDEGRDGGNRDDGNRDGGNRDDGNRDDGNDQGRNNRDDNSRQQRVGGRVELQVYDRANCRNSDNVESREWNCISPRGECNAVSFPVLSFSIAMTDPRDVGQGNCSIAQTSGTGRTSSSSRVAVAVMLVLGAMVSLL